MVNKPNILILMTDQLRRDALGVYGDPNVSTPNIDRLAEQGVRFDSACSTYPVCVPFRFTLMTGEYAHTRNIPGLAFAIDPSERTLADEFNVAGYHTAYFGKWHLAHVSTSSPVPSELQGRWQKWFGFDVRNDHFNSIYFEDDDPEPKPIPGYQTDGLFTMCMDYLGSDARPADKPFCCVLSVEPPHFPYEAPKEYIDRWRGREIVLPPSFEKEASYEIPLSQWPGDDTHTTEIKRDRVRTYYAMIENLDDNVGKMMEFLQSTDDLSNTIVMFVADHGETGGAHGLPTAMKNYPFETCVGIPLIVSGPGIAEGSIIPEPVCTEDLFPTLCGFADITPQNSLPGLDLSRNCKGESASIDREGILLEFVRDTRSKAAFYKKGYRAFRTDRYKYSVLAEEGRPGKPWQFFDMKEDPHEITNLINVEGYYDQIETLHNLLREKLVEAGDEFLIEGSGFGVQGSGRNWE